MAESILKVKSFAFAIPDSTAFSILADRQKEYVLAKQLLRCGTSVGSMVREAEHAESRADFIHKMAIAQKEINEALYWLELLTATDYLSVEQAASINADAIELLKILTSSIKTAKSNDRT